MTTGLKASHFGESTLAQKNGPRIQTPYSKSMNRVPFCWEKNVLTDDLHIKTNLPMMLKKLTMAGVAFSFGHPV